MATAVRRSALERHASHSRRNAVVREFLPLADALARRVQRRFPDLIELDDARQVARYELIRAASCLEAGFHPAPFLKPRIQEALQHDLRDHGRLVRVPRREHEKGIHPLGHQSLDAAGPSASPYLDALASPVNEAAILRLRVLENRTLRSLAGELGMRATSDGEEAPIGRGGVPQRLSAHEHAQQALHEPIDDPAAPAELWHSDPTTGPPWRIAPRTG